MASGKPSNTQDSLQVKRRESAFFTTACCSTFHGACVEPPDGENTWQLPSTFTVGFCGSDHTSCESQDIDSEEAEGRERARHSRGCSEGERGMPYFSSFLTYTGNFAIKWTGYQVYFSRAHEALGPLIAEIQRQ